MNTDATPETPRPIEDLAGDIQSLVRQLESLVYALDGAIDDIHGADMIGAIGRALSFISLHQDVTPKVLKIAEEIETRALADRNEDMARGAGR